MSNLCPIFPIYSLNWDTQRAIAYMSNMCPPIPNFSSQLRYVEINSLDVQLVSPYSQFIFSTETHRKQYLRCPTSAPIFPIYPLNWDTQRAIAYMSNLCPQLPNLFSQLRHTESNSLDVQLVPPIFPIYPLNWDTQRAIAAACFPGQ